MQTINQTKNRKPQVKSLLVYIKTLSEKDLNTFAESCGTTTGNIQQIAYGGSVSARLSKKINEHSKKLVSLTDLRPDIFY